MQLGEINVVTSTSSISSPRNGYFASVLGVKQKILSIKRLGCLNCLVHPNKPLMADVSPGCWQKIKQCEEGD